MRKLKMKDVSPAIRLVKGINATEEIKTILADETKTMSVRGVEVIGIILTKFGESPELEKQLAEFLAGLFEISADEVLDLDIDEFINGIKEIGGISAFASFFEKSLA